MSDVLDPVDQAAIVQFKKCFGGAATAPILKAYTTVAVTPKQIEAEKRKVSDADDLAARKKKAWEEKRDRRVAKSSAPPSKSETEDQDAHEAATQDAAIAREKLARLQAELAAAERAKIDSPRGAYSDKLRGLRQRLETSGFGTKDVAATHWDKAQKLYIDDKFEGMDQALAELEVEIVKVVAAKEFATKTAETRKRIEALRAAKYQNVKLVDDIERQATDAPMTKLEDAIDPMLAVAESQVAEFAAALAALQQDLQAVIEGESLPAEAYADQQKAIQKTATLAVKTVEKAAATLPALDADIGKLTEAAATAAGFRDDYPDLLDEVKQAMIDVPAKSATHKGLMTPRPGKLLKDADFCFKERAFAAAVSWLDAAQEELQDIDLRAELRIKNVADKDAAAATQLAKQQQQTAAVKAKAAAQLLREDAPTVASLRAIGRDNKFPKWYGKVKTLLDSGLVTVSGSEAYFLRGDNTVEVTLTITAVATNRAVDRFVVHYHPQAQAETSTTIGASQMHVKPRRGNAQTIHITIANTDWPVARGFAPSWGTVKHNFR